MEYRNVAVVLFLLVTGAVLAAASAPQPGGELRFAIQGEPKTFDPLRATADEPSEMIRFLMHGTLVRLNRASQALEPELAVGWKALPGGKKLAVDLRMGVKFSDGTPFTAADVCFTLLRLNDPQLESPLADLFAVDKGPLSCEAPSPAKVIIGIAAATSAMERLLDGLGIQSASAKDRERAVLGPFQLAEYRPGAYVVLSRNPHYWKRDSSGRQLPYLDAVRMEIQRNRRFEMMRFRGGEYDLVNNLDTELLEQLKRDSPQAIRDLGVSLDSEQIWFNQSPRAPIPAHRKAWFRNKEFRKAVSQAIRRADLVKVVYQGYAAPAYGPVSPSNRAWHNPRISAPPPDAPAARERLVKAGFRYVGNTLQDSSGQPVQFSLITNSGNRARERMAALIQQDLAAIGMKVTVAPLDFPSLIDRIMRSYDYEACLLGLINTDLDPNAQMSVWLSSSAMHQWNPNQEKPETEWEAEIDRLMRAQAVETDPKKRKAAFDRVQEIVADELPFIYLIYRHALVAVGPGLRNVEPSVLRPQLLWNAERLYRVDGRAVAQR